MITSSMTVQRYAGDTHRTRIGVLASPEFGDIATLAVNTQGIDIHVYLNVPDLEMLRARIDEVLAQLEAHREAA